MAAFSSSDARRVPVGASRGSTQRGVTTDDQQGSALPGAAARVLVVEDHDLLAHSLAATLAAEGVYAETAAAESGEDVTSAVRAGAFDLVLLDLDLGAAGSGFGLIEPLCETGARVVMLTASTDDLTLEECIEAGAVGVVHKSASFEGLMAGVRDAVTLGSLFSPGQRDDLMADLRQRRQERAERLGVFEALTPRERGVLSALMDGKTADDIAKDEVVSITTVRSHIRSLLSKLGVHSQIAAIGLARNAGWEPPAQA
jgi:DNA-binding NarL/FixJ family response regulator